MAYESVYHPGFPVVVKLGKSAGVFRCGCTKRCRHMIQAGDPVAFVRMQDAWGKSHAHLLCLSHFEKNFKEI